MSSYVISDLHGQLDAFDDLLEKCAFDPEKDQLYLLGDYVDWGAKSIDLMLRIIWMMEHGYPVRCLLGNHDLLMREVIRRLKPKEEFWLDSLFRDEWFRWWQDNAGLETLLQYVSLSEYKRRKIRKFLKNLEHFVDDLQVADRHFYLCHSVPFPSGELGLMPLLEQLFIRTWEYDFKPFRTAHPDDIILCGHTITHLYWTSRTRRSKSLSSRRNISIEPYDKNDTFQVYYDAPLGFINLDCGAKLLGNSTYGDAKLACLRLDDFRVFYSSKA